MSNNNQDQALRDAARRGNLEAAKQALNNGANINTKASSLYGSTPLHYASAYGHVDVVSWLLEKGANVNVTHDYGSTPVHDACYNGHETICSLLLQQNGANNTINAKDIRGDTPLHNASYNGYDSICTLLLQNGANPNITNNKGMTPLQRAQSNNKQNCVDAIKQQQFKNECLNKFPTRTALDRELARLKRIFENARSYTDATSQARMDYERLLLSCNWPEYMEVLKLEETVRQKEEEAEAMEIGSNERIEAWQEVDHLKARLQREYDDGAEPSAIENSEQRQPALTRAHSSLNAAPPVEQVAFNNEAGTVVSTMTVSEFVSVTHQGSPEEVYQSHNTLATMIASRFNNVEDLIRVSTSLNLTEELKVPQMWLLLPEGQNAIRKKARVYFLCSHGQNAIRKKARVYFLCPHDNTPIKTSIVIKQPRKWVGKIAPALKASLFVINIVLRIYQIPIPINIEGINLETPAGMDEYLTQLIDLLGEEAIERIQSLIREAERHKDSLDGLEAIKTIMDDDDLKIPIEASTYLMAKAYKPKHIGSWRNEMTLASKGCQYAWVKNENVDSWKNTP